ncbi:MAG: hypothetical protein OEX01_05735 [Candidatus Bathyarchaeota archaeon]|nr:hypothetical protein [Candidatus Bathyarchaeota archaeon]
MKRIETWLNEKQYKRFIKKVEAKKLTPYAFLKQLVLKELS